MKTWKYVIGFVIVSVIAVSVVIVMRNPVKEPAVAAKASTASHQAADRLTSSTGVSREESLDAEPGVVAAKENEEKAARLAKFANALSARTADERHKDFLSSLDTLDPTDATEVYEMLERLKNSGRDVGFELDALSRRWGVIDPLGALAKLDSKPLDKRSKGEYENVFQGWSSKDHRGVEDWLNANGQHPQFEQAFLGYLEGYAPRDLTAATKTAISSLKSDDPLLPEALSRLARSARNMSLGTMKSWFDQLPSDAASLPMKSIASKAVYQLLPRDRYAENANWVAEQGKTPWRNNSMIANFSRDYADSFPKAAMNWVQATEPTQDKGIIIGVGEIVRAWEKRSLKDLQLWLEQNPASPAFQQAAHDLAISLSKKNPPLAQYWTDKITAPTYRAQAQSAVSKAQQGSPDQK